MFRLFLLSVLGLAFCALVPQPARADTWNDRVILTVNDPISVNGRVLEPGKYLIEAANAGEPKQLINVYTADKKHLITTVLTLPIYREQPPNEVRVKLWETPVGAPQALRSLFFPGEHYGVQFPAPRDIHESPVAAAD